MGPVATADVRGLAELLQALRVVNKGAAKAVTRGLKEAADPIRDSAERMAVAEITNIGTHWPRMRIGVSARQGLVYMVPLSRNAGYPKRPNLSPLLLDGAMWPAVEKHQDEIHDDVEKALGVLAYQAGL